MAKIPVKRVFVFDDAGLVTVVGFKENGEYKVFINWSEELSVRGAKFVALALRKRAEENIEFMEPRKDLIVHIGPRFIVAMELRKLSKNDAKRLLKKVNEILTALKTFDPKEIGEVVARAVRSEFLLG